MLLLEATAKIAGRRGIGNAQGVQGIQVRFILSPQLQVLQTAAVTQRVVGDVQHMIGFVVWQVDLEQVQMLVDRSREAQRLGQLMHETNAAISSANRSLRHFVMRVDNSEHRLLEIIGKVVSVQARLDSLLASATAIRHTLFHSKSLRVNGALLGGHSLNTAERRRISSFLSIRADSRK